MRELEADIVQNINIARNIYLLSLKLPENFAQEVVPGQFAHIKAPCGRGNRLRSPFICRAHFGLRLRGGAGFQERGIFLSAGSI